MTNPQVLAWFESGHIADAVLGGEPYFLPSVTWYDEHAHIVILRELHSWAGNDSAKRAVAISGFRSALVTALVDDDANAVYRVLFAFFSVARELSDPLPIDAEEIGRWLDELEARLLPGGDAIAILRNKVREHIPTRQHSSWDDYKTPSRYPYFPRNVGSGYAWKMRLLDSTHLVYSEGDLEGNIRVDFDGPSVRLHPNSMQWTQPFERPMSEAERTIVLERVTKMIRAIGEHYTVA